MITNTIPELVSQLIFKSLEPELVYSDMFNTDYQGELGDLGSQLTINSIDSFTIGDYTPGTTSISFEEVDTTSQTMTVDLSKYFGFKLYDVNRKQSINKVILAESSVRAGQDLAKVYDAYLRDKFLDATGTITTDLGDDTTALDVGETGDVTVSEFFARVSKKLDEANLPRAGRVIVIPPALMEKMVLNSDFLANNESLENGFIGHYMGFSVRVSNQVSHTSGASYKIVATAPMSATRAVQIDGVETCRIETEFATGVKGYLVGAARVTRPEAVAVATIDIV